jgi:hypothetical protein
VGCEKRKGGIRGGHVDAELGRGSRRQNPAVQKLDGRRGLLMLMADESRRRAAPEGKLSSERRDMLVDAACIHHTTTSVSAEVYFQPGLNFYLSFLPRSCHLLMMQRLAAKPAVDAQATYLMPPKDHTLRNAEESHHSGNALPSL